MTQAGENEVAAAKKGPGNGIVFSDGRWVTLCGASEPPLGGYVTKDGAPVEPETPQDKENNDGDE
jgi:hypothetical protein